MNNPCATIIYFTLQFVYISEIIVILFYWFPYDSTLHHQIAGEVQAERAAELMGFHTCGFRPHHSSKLGNEFRLFTNYNPGTRLGGWEQ